jgi:peroxiredoxin
MPISPADMLAPDFALLDGDGNFVRLSDYRGKNVVLSFYPADWSPVCSSELSLFQECLEEIGHYDAQVLGISVDGPFCHHAWAEHLRITFPLLSDFWPHGQVAREYGVFRADEGVADRALFFIDKDGAIRQTWLAEQPNLAPGLNVVFDALERLHALQVREQPRA